MVLTPERMYTVPDLLHIMNIVNGLLVRRLIIRRTSTEQGSEKFYYFESFKFTFILCILVRTCSFRIMIERTLKKVKLWAMSFFFFFFSACKYI